MKILRLMLLAGLIGGGWQYWNKQHAAAVMAAATSPNGFVALSAPAEATAGRVLVIAPENCTADAARRADDLALDLAQAKVPVQRLHAVNFNFENPDAATLQRLREVMGSEPPIVFVGDRASANPTLAEVLAEYRR